MWDQTQPSCIGSAGLSHWTTREVPISLSYPFLVKTWGTCLVRAFFFRVGSVLVEVCRGRKMENDSVINREDEAITTWS